MVPFILAQQPRDLLVALPGSGLDVAHRRDLAFFLKRGIDLPDITASATWTQKEVTKSTGTPPEGPFTDSDEKTYNEPDEHYDPD